MISRITAGEHPEIFGFSNTSNSAGGIRNNDNATIIVTKRHQIKQLALHQRRQTHLHATLI